MKKAGLIIGLLFASTSLLFAADCGNLAMTIVNDTDKACVLRYSTFYAGKSEDPIPTLIPAHSTSPKFYLKQDLSGIGLFLDYRCEGNVVTFYSQQESCWFNAGKIAGFDYYVNDLVVDYHAVVGSYWGSLPGQMTWTIH